MGWLEAIAALFRSLAWPVTTIVAVIVFRRPITALIQSLRSVKYKDIEAKFERDLDRAEETLLPAPTEAAATSSRNAFALDSTSRTSSPEKRITRAWYAVRRVIWEVAQKSGIPAGSHLKPLTTITWMEKEKYIDSATAELLRDLRHLRYTVQSNHGVMNIDSEQAERFEELASRAINILNAIKVAPKPYN